MSAHRNPIHLLAGLGGCVVACAAGCAAEPGEPGERNPEPATATSALAARPIDPARAAQLVSRARALVKPGSQIHTESRLGVPTFLWTGAPSAVNRTALTQISGAAHPAIPAARAVLADYAALYGLSDDDVTDAVVATVDHRAGGPAIVKLRAERGGIEIFGEELNVLMNPGLEGVALSGYLTSPATPAARGGGLGFATSPATAAATALGQLAHAQIAPSQLIATTTSGRYHQFVTAPAAGIALDDEIRVKQVYFHLPEGLEAAYYVEVAALTGAPPAGVIAADGGAIATSEACSYVVSATTGEILFRKNLIAEALPPGGFTYRVWADPVTGIPRDTPAGNGVDPKIDPIPDGVQYGFVATDDVTLPNFPFSQNDPWIAPGATETVGNNVDAFLNLFAPDGLGNPIVTTPTDPPTGDYRAQITGVDQFLHSQTPDGNGALAEGRQGAIQQLFYTINFLHDWYYDAGFNEAAGNAQTSNYGRGGVAADSIKGQVQDFSGFSNANMLTGADGARPRMRMYIFPSPANMLDLQAPLAIVGKTTIGVAIAGTQTFDVTTDIVRATFSNTPAACTVTNAGALAGKIAMFDFDNTDGVGCAFSTRITRLSQGTTAAAIMMVYTSVAPTVVANITGFVTTFTKPVATISWNTGQAIKGQLSLPATVTARLLRAPDRDGALDNQVVFHEWFHYASNRLVGNGSGLNSQMSAGMGEGWSDVNAMMLTVRPDDTTTPSNAQFDGVYAMATYATSGVPFNGSANQGYYYGIRRYPYSTDLAINPLTYKHISNGVALPVSPPPSFGADGASNAEVHNTGEVWAVTLWECYAALLRDTLGATPRLTFQQAQDRMKQYLISALKLTPTSPTLLEARDALLAVAFASDATDYVEFRIAFAKRGMGLHAESPDRFTTDNTGAVEDFFTGPELSFVSATADDTPGTCDDDGVVDHGEYGRIVITLRNTGTVPLSSTTATISTASSDVWFPLATTVTFPPTAPGATTTASVVFAYLRTVTGIQQVDFQIAYNDGLLGGPPATTTVGFRTNSDEVPQSSATDTVEPAAPPWIPAFNPSLSNVAPWKRIEIDPLNHLWHADDPSASSDQYLVSPVFTVDGTGSLDLQFDHGWSFEFDVSGNFDGGVVEMSVNGGAFTDIGSSAYNGTILTYAGDTNPLKGRPGFVQASGGMVHTSLTQAIAPGSTVQIRFRSGSDAGGAAAGWDIDNIAFAGVVETPFATLVPDSDSCTVVPESADVAITIDDIVATAVAGNAVTYAVTASNNGPDSLLGAPVTATFASELTGCTWTCAGSGGGSCAATGSGNIADSPALPAGGSATYTATCALPVSTTAISIASVATIAPPGPVNDPTPANNAASDIDAVVHIPAAVFGSKTVSGSFTPGGTVTYTIGLVNFGSGVQSDNPGNEFIDVLPATLTLVSANASTGTAVATLGTNTVTWNGAIAAGNGVTITIVATIAATAGAKVSNQGTFVYDDQGVGVNSASGVTEAFVCNQGVQAGGEVLELPGLSGLTAPAALRPR